MAATSEKARYYLERSVPELKELGQKGIFSKNEIINIAEKRSEFEHKINARGSQPSDFARYAEWEMNVDSLRRKRMKKLGVRAAGYSRQRRIFFVLERATRKFPGALILWIQFLEFTKHVKANRKLLKILDEVLRLHPTKPELWIYASQHHMGVEADFAAARNCMQAGMRFCPKSSGLWLEYARLEVAYLAKIAGRRIVMGLDDRPESEVQIEKDAIDENVILLPTTNFDESDAHDAEIQKSMKENVKMDSLFEGAIPQAIFKDAMRRFSHNRDLSAQFFDIFWEYRWINAIRNLSTQVLEYMSQTFPQAPETMVCKCKLQYGNTSPQSPDFPILVANSLREIKAYTGDSPAEKTKLTSKFLVVLLRILDQNDLDDDVRAVILSSVRSFSISIQDMPPENKRYMSKLHELKAQYPSAARYLIVGNPSSSVFTCSQKHLTGSEFSVLNP